MSIDLKELAARFATIKVLVVDDEYYMRKVVRTLSMPRQTLGKSMILG